jgi:hypothetical protein
MSASLVWARIVAREGSFGLVGIRQRRWASQRRPQWSATAARDVARRGVDRTEVDDDLVPPPKYLRRRGTGCVGFGYWTGPGLLLGLPSWAAAAADWVSR